MVGIVCRWWWKLWRNALCCPQKCSPNALSFYSLNCLLNFDEFCLTLVKSLRDEHLPSFTKMLGDLVEFLRHYKEQCGTKQPSEDLASVSHEICTKWEALRYTRVPKRQWPKFQSRLPMRAECNPEQYAFALRTDLGLLPRPAKEACATFLFSLWYRLLGD